MYNTNFIIKYQHHYKNLQIQLMCCWQNSHVHRPHAPCIYLPLFLKAKGLIEKSKESCDFFKRTEVVTDFSLVPSALCNQG